MTTKVTAAPLTRSVREIALEIHHDWPAAREGGSYDPRWGCNVGEHPAHPYLQAMLTIGSLEESYGYDSAAHVVRYFLENTSGWRGETARRIKAELRAALADHDARRRAVRR